jgi:hypothetical protein
MLLIWVDAQYFVERAMLDKLVGVQFNRLRPDCIVIHPDDLTAVKPHQAIRAGIYVDNLHKALRDRKHRIYIADYHR